MTLDKWNDFDFVKKVVNKNGIALKHASENLKANKELVKIAVKNNYKALFINKNFIYDKELIIEAIKNNGFYTFRYYEYLDIPFWNELRNDREFMKEAIKIDGYNIKFAAHHIRNDREILLSAIKQRLSGKILKCVEQHFWNDDELIIEAIKWDGMSLKYASDKLKNNREIIKMAINSLAPSFKFASEHIRYNDMELIILAIKKYGVNIRYTSEKLKNNREMVRLATITKTYCNIIFKFVSDYYKMEYEYYGKILNFKKLKKRMWRENGIAQQLILFLTCPAHLNTKFRKCGFE